MNNELYDINYIKELWYESFNKFKSSALSKFVFDCFLNNAKDDANMILVATTLIEMQVDKSSDFVFILNPESSLENPLEKEPLVFEKKLVEGRLMFRKV